MALAILGQTAYHDFIAYTFLFFVCLSFSAPHFHTKLCSTCCTSAGRGEEGFVKDLIGQYSIGNENEQMDCCHCLKGCCAPALQIDPLAQISVGPPDYQSGFGTNKITGIKKNLLPFEAQVVAQVPY